PRDPAVDDAVLDVLRDVRRADEQHLDRRVAARECQGALSRLLRAEPRVLEQAERRLAEPPLDRAGEPQEPVRSSARAWPPSPWPGRNQCATRVTVVVDAPVR